MANTIRGVADDIGAVIYNPTAVIERVIQTAQSALVNGEAIDIAEPSGPLPFLLEAGVAMLQSAVDFDEKNNRRAYPSMSTQLSEVFDHISDESYYNVFAVPSNQTFTMIIGKDELKNRAVPPDSKDVRKIIIPADTQWEVAGHTFTIQYPIELRVMPHGAIQVLYDTTYTSPIQELSQNVLEWELQPIEYDGIALDFIKVDIPTLQYKITEQRASVTPGIEFREQYGFEDKFFCARVWMRRNQGWVELLTTHSERVVDPFRPTAMLRVLERELEVYIPDIYIRKGVVSGDIRVDIYTTKGKIDLDLRGYYNEEFTVNYRDLNQITETRYVEPLRQLTHIRYWCTEYIRGGRDSLSFMEVRDRTIDNSVGSRQIPISEKQLQATLLDLNYTVSKSIDMVTGRIYQAATDMPPSTLKEVSTPIGTVNGILNTSMHDLSLLPTVKNNGNRLTILPNTLYREQDGLVYLDTQGGIDYYNSLPTAERVGAINSNHFLYTPFHYLLDTNSDVFEVRPYYMANPTITGKRFIETNATLLLDVGVGKYAIEPHPLGYRLLLTTRSTDTYQTLPVDVCGVQISYVPRGFTNQVAYLDGKFEGMADKERVFSFIIESNMDIDKNHDLIVSSFTMFSDDPNDIAMRLDVEMNVIFTVNGYVITDYLPIDADKVLVNNKNNGGLSLKAVTHEVLKFDLGTYLGTLWPNGRNVAGPMDYMRYEEDVIATYPKDEFVRDSKGLAVLTNGKLTYKHRAGDPIIIDGATRILHPAGSIIKDADDKPIIKEPRKLRRRIELFLFDARYVLANADDVVAYRQLVVDHVMKGIKTDIPSVMGQMHDQTKVYYYPKNTMGWVNVRQADNKLNRIYGELAFNMRFSVTDTVRKNADLLASMKREARKVIMDGLSGRIVSVSEILEMQRDHMRDDIIDVDMDKMGEDFDQATYIVINNNDKLTLGKYAVARADGKIELRDDVNVSFNRVNT